MQEQAEKLEAPPVSDMAPPKTVHDERAAPVSPEEDLPALLLLSTQVEQEKAPPPRAMAPP
jgi:hypothetical protein